MREEATRERYVRDPVPVRLGGLAANLARVKSFSDHPHHREVVDGLLRESMLFIEWTAEAAGPDVQAQLVELRTELARWRDNWGAIWANAERRAAVAEEAEKWSVRVLRMSGLLAELT